MGVFMKAADIKETEEKHFKRVLSIKDEVETKVLHHKQQRFTVIMTSRGLWLDLSWKVRERWCWNVSYTVHEEESN